MGGRVTHILDSGDGSDVYICKTSWNQTLHMDTFLICKLYTSKFLRRRRRRRKERPIFIWALLPGHVMAKLKPPGNLQLLWPFLVSGKLQLSKSPRVPWLILTTLSKPQERTQASPAASCCP